MTFLDDIERHLGQNGVVSWDRDMSRLDRRQMRGAHWVSARRCYACKPYTPDPDDVPAHLFEKVFGPDKLSGQVHDLRTGGYVVHYHADYVQAFGAVLGDCKLYKDVWKHGYWTGACRVLCIPEPDDPLGMYWINTTDLHQFPMEPPEVMYARLMRNVI